MIILKCCITGGSGINHREYSTFKADRLGMILGLVGIFITFRIHKDISEQF
ncbi:hypothetical protein KQI61_02560 [Anaerocolumna aminovalerica]|nr:hypothetical protein [Anaerocolumna aminovalerica]